MHELIYYLSMVAPVRDGASLICCGIEVLTSSGQFFDQYFTWIEMIMRVFLKRIYEYMSMID